MKSGDLEFEVQISRPWSDGTHLFNVVRLTRALEVGESRRFTNRQTVALKSLCAHRRVSSGSYSTKWEHHPRGHLTTVRTVVFRYLQSVLIYYEFNLLQFDLLAFGESSSLIFEAITRALYTLSGARFSLLKAEDTSGAVKFGNLLNLASLIIFEKSQPLLAFPGALLCVQTTMFNDIQSLEIINFFFNLNFKSLPRRLAHQPSDR